MFCNADRGGWTAMQFVRCQSELGFLTFEKGRKYKFLAGWRTFKEKV